MLQIQTFYLTIKKELKNKTRQTKQKQTQEYTYLASQAKQSLCHHQCPNISNYTRFLKTCGVSRTNPVITIICKVNKRKKSQEAKKVRNKRVCKNKQTIQE